MAIFKVEEIRKMSKEARVKELAELKAELSSLMSKKSMGGSLENPARIGLLRRTIAKFYTINREEELGIVRSTEEKKEKPKKKEKEKEKKEKETKEKAAPKKAKKAKKEEVQEEAEEEEEDES
jgi:ribosomal protein L29